KSVGEAALCLGRAIAGQNVFARGLEVFGRDAGFIGRSIQRPAEMFARMLHADARTVMRDHLVVELADDRELFGERRRGTLLAGDKIMREMAGEPRPAI